MNSRAAANKRKTWVRKGRGGMRASRQGAGEGGQVEMARGAAAARPGIEFFLSSC